MMLLVSFLPLHLVDIVVINVILLLLASVSN
jgi:hypothetical protein